VQRVRHGSVQHMSALLRWAQALVAVPYMWGGSDTQSFDCSALVARTLDMP
jgi:cell wall-associated NlpC family hydrolase